MAGLRLPWAGPPLVPDPDEARRWAEQELADPAYRAAEPTGIDRFARDLAEWLGRLADISPDGGAGQIGAILLAVVVVLVAVGAFLVWGRPRLVARERTDTTLFGAERAVPAAEHRRRASDAAARQDWDTAIVERMRAIARALAERLVVDDTPGATVHGFSTRAATAFPAQAEALEGAATAFDDVRYLRRPGTAEAYAELEALDARLAAARPVLPEALV